MAEDESVLMRQAAPPDVVVAYGDQVDQVADVRFAMGDTSPQPLLVIIHGGFWRPQYGRDQTGPMAETLAAAGWTTAAVGYRRVPGQPDASVTDIAAALECLPARVARHDGRVIAVGHSAGGHLALLSAAAPPTSALVGVLGLAPAADLQLAHALGLGGGAVQDFLGDAPQSRPDLDPRLRAPAVDTLVLHGDADAIVPLEVSESYAAAHPAVTLRRLAGCGHFALIDPRSAAWSDVIAALRALSRRKASRNG